MPAFKDLSGKTFGKITVSSSHMFTGRETIWLVSCTCGKSWWIRQPYRLKACWECAHLKQSSEYHRRRGNERMRLWRANNPERYQSNRKAYYEKNREKCIAAVRDWTSRNREHVRNKRFLRRYGLTPEAYQKLLASQNYCCAVCEQDMRTIPHGPQVDHNHVTKEVRGLLCILCNTGIGKFKESAELMRAAITYLEALRIKPTW